MSGCSCVCPHMCVCVYTYTHTCIHVEVLPQVLSILCLRQRLLSWNLPCRQGYVASRPQGSTCLNSPSAGIKRINQYFWLFCGSIGTTSHLLKTRASSPERSFILKDDIINLCNIRKNNYKKKTQKLLPT